MKTPVAAHTHVNARMFPKRCSQECEHDTEECVRHKHVARN